MQGDHVPDDEDNDDGGTGTGRKIGEFIVLRDENGLYYVMIDDERIEANSVSDLEAEVAARTPRLGM